jgi:predicted TIM-barrel fold metal-dependent hydrolase
MSMSHEEWRAARIERRSEVTFLPEPDSEPLFCPVISVDDHLLEPLDVFEDRLPRKYAESGPRVEFDQEGCPWWIVDGDRAPVLLANGAVGRPISEWRIAPSRYEEMRDGVWNAQRRLADMDICGVWASLCFASIPWGFAGHRFSTMRDPEMGLASLRAYNDWIIDDWCATDPDRFIPCQLPWLRDPLIGAEEVRRNASRGFKAVSFSENPEPRGFPTIYSKSWDPFFQACEETGTVVNLHVGSSGLASVVCSDSPVDVSVALFPMHAFRAALDWIYARIPLRFPGLKIALSEGGVSWVPGLMERLGRAYRHVDHSLVWSRSDPDPTELLLNHFYFCSIEDPSAFLMLDRIGEDRVMVETDYPHFDSSWPHSQRLFRSEFEGHLKPAQIRKLCFENAAALYRHPAPPKGLIDRSAVGAD